MEGYAEIFRKQVFTPDVDNKVVQEAVKITHTQSKKVGSTLSLMIPPLTFILATAGIWT